MLVANGEEPAITNKTSSFAGCLDYIWLLRGRWAVTATMRLPYSQQAGPDPDMLDFPPCPNPLQPSDHLPIGCQLHLLTP